MPRWSRTSLSLRPASDRSVNAMSENRNLWRDWNRLADHLQFADREALQDWIRSPLFFPYWTRLRDNCIIPAQQDLPPGQARRKGPELRVVQGRITAGERGGHRTYSRDQIDTSAWNVVDHYALFIYKTVTVNQLDLHGIFFRRSAPDHECQAKIWQVLQRMAFDLAPARVASGSRGTALLPTNDLPSSGPGPSSHSSPARNTRVRIVWQEMPADIDDEYETFTVPVSALSWAQFKQAVSDHCSFPQMALCIDKVNWQIFKIARVDLGWVSGVEKIDFRSQMLARSGVDL